MSKPNLRQKLSDLWADMTTTGTVKVPLEAELPTAPIAVWNEARQTEVFQEFQGAMSALKTKLTGHGLEVWREFVLLQSIEQHFASRHTAEDFLECGNIERLTGAVKSLSVALEKKFGISKAPTEELGRLRRVVQTITEYEAAQEASCDMLAIPIRGDEADVVELRSRLEAAATKIVADFQRDLAERHGYVQEEFRGSQVFVQKDEHGEMVDRILLCGESIQLPEYLREVLGSMSEEFRGSLDPEAQAASV